jgi:uncharacterized protein with GYD domain
MVQATIRESERERLPGKPEFSASIAYNRSPMHHPSGAYSIVLKEVQMPKYLVQANYGSEGLKGLLKEGGSKRRAAVVKLFESVGGKVEAFYFAFGDTDLFVVADVPDNVSAAALSLTVNASGAATAKVTVLMTPEEVDAAVKKTPSYRAPGK